MIVLLKVTTAAILGATVGTVLYPTIGLWALACGVPVGLFCGFAKVGAEL